MKLFILITGVPPLARNVFPTAGGVARFRAPWMGFLLSLGFSLASAARAATVTEDWVQHVRPPGATYLTDAARKAAMDSAGDILMTGNTEGGLDNSHILTLKISSFTGNVLWRRDYVGSAQLYDRVDDMTLDLSGNVIIGGASSTLDGDGFYLAKYAATDGAVLWERHTTGTEGSHYVQCLTTDSQGDVFVAGESYEGGWSIYYMTKYAAADGHVLWENRQVFNIISMKVDANNDLIAIGSVYNATENLQIAKYASADGALRWEKTYDGGGPDNATAVALDSNGNAIVTGSSYHAGNSDIYTAKFAAATGQVLWERRYNGSANGDDAARAISVDPAGNALVIGDSSEFDGRLTYLAQYAATNGALMWEKLGSFNTVTTYDLTGNIVVISNDWANTNLHFLSFAATDGALLDDKPSAHLATNLVYALSLQLASGGDLLVAGNAWDRRTGGSFFAARYAAADAHPLWEQRAQGPGYHDADIIAMATDSHGNTLMLWRASNGSTYDHHLSKHAAANGALLWSLQFDGQQVDDSGKTGLDVDGQIAIDAEDNVIVTAYARGLEGPIRHHTSKHASADGAVLWEHEDSGPSSGDGGSQALTLDADGNVFMVAYTFSCPGSAYYFVKYAATDGAPLWERRCEDFEGLDLCQRFSGVAADLSGNVLVIGSSPQGGAYLAKHSGLNGALLWARDFPADSFAFITTDPEGNAIVAGSGYNGTNSDFYVAKFDGADGSRVWEGYANGPNDLPDSLADAVVDAVGNVFTVGSSWNGSNYDLFAAKFGPEGAVLWRRTYNGPANLDYGAAAALGANGNVIVSGYSGSPTNSDLYVAEYASIDGSIVWEKRFNGAGRSSGRPRNLAVAPGGAILVDGRSDAGFDHGENFEIVLIKYVEPATVARLPGETGYRVEFPVVPGLHYTLQRAVTPVGPWEDLITSTAPPAGRLTYTDTSLPGRSAFYRTVTP